MRVFCRLHTTVFISLQDPYWLTTPPPPHHVLSIISLCLVPAADLYPLSKIKLADNPYVPLMMPDVAYSPWDFLRSFDDIKALNISWPFGIIPTDYQVRSAASSAFPALSLGFTILLLLPSLLCLWASPFFFFCLPQLYLWASPFFFFCLPCSVSGVHHSSSSSTFPAISLGFTILLLLCSQLYLWASPFFFFCVPSFISGLHHSSSSSTFPAIPQGFTILLLLLPSPAISLGFTILLLLRSQLYLWASSFFFFCVPSYVSRLHHSSSCAFPAISLGFIILLLLHTGSLA